MRMAILSVRDSAVDSYMPPVFTRSLGEAERMFKDEINSENASNLTKHPDDFVLWHMGWFETDDGKFDLFRDPQQLLRGKDCVNAAREE